MVFDFSDDLKLCLFRVIALELSHLDLFYPSELLGYQVFFEGQYISQHQTAFLKTLLSLLPLDESIGVIDEEISVNFSKF